ncbi:ribosome maturation factor RimM [Fodinibius halophilus]|uniref:Ribosome maturation factor RimM n=1 Tax=Fodinibius halophilus TaxID=1736908 RepID=A0A6M1TFB1_9BACT|nr:ribosome maturation factor RimM [Fodinibius halophilus]NGP87300.1 16S rRNA processing protein RimM [Fodinibius halophilus]
MLEPIENQYKQIGYISRSHGVAGDVLIIPDIYAPTLFDALELVHIANTRGDLVPARIESVRVQEKNNRLSFFVKFEHVTDRTQAEKLKNFTVYADREIVNSLLDSDELPLKLTSFEVLEDEEAVGTVKALLENPAHPILEVVTTGQEQLLIPFVDEYVVDIDEESQNIQCKNLDQLRGL